MKARMVVAVAATSIGGLLLLVGLIVGFRPLEYLGSDCGSAFRGEWSRSMACDDVRSMVSLFAWPMTIAGVVLTVLGVLAWIGAVAPDDAELESSTR